MTDSEIYDQLERLAAKYPWDTVAIWARRRPSGVLEFTAYIEDNEKLGFRSVFGHGRSAVEAAEDAIKDAGERDPEKQRKAKINEFERMSFLLPPYRAPGQIGHGEPEPVAPPPGRVIEIEGKEAL